MHAPMYLKGCFSETNKQTNKKTPTQNMKHTTYPIRFVAVTNSCKGIDCFGFIFQNPRCASSRACYINHFARTLRNLLYEKGLLTTINKAVKVLWRAKKDIQHFLLTVSQTARTNGNIIFKLIWIAGLNRQLTKSLPSQISKLPCSWLTLAKSSPTINTFLMLSGGGNFVT